MGLQEKRKSKYYCQVLKLNSLNFLQGTPGIPNGWFDIRKTFNSRCKVFHLFAIHSRLALVGKVFPNCGYLLALKRCYCQNLFLFHRPSLVLELTALFLVRIRHSVEHNAHLESDRVGYGLHHTRRTGVQTVHVLVLLVHQVGLIKRHNTQLLVRSVVHLTDGVTHFSVKFCCRRPKDCAALSLVTLGQDYWP